MDYMCGGDLRQHLQSQKRLSEGQTKFVIGCIVLGLEQIHQSGVIHRDIKPENIVFDEDGYAKVTDFGISKPWKLENQGDTSGTASYMAPESLLGQSYSFEVDFYALGIIMYEGIVGQRPYKVGSRTEAKEMLSNKQFRLKRSHVSMTRWSDEALIFCNQLLTKKNQSRLGFNGVQEIKDHPWFSEFSWEKLRLKQILSPFKALISDLRDRQKKFEESFDNRENQWARKLAQKEVQKLFDGYEFEKISRDQTKAELSLEQKSTKTS